MFNDQIIPFHVFFGSVKKLLKRSRHSVILIPFDEI